MPVTVIHDDFNQRVERIRLTGDAVQSVRVTPDGADAIVELIAGSGGGTPSGEHSSDLGNLAVPTVINLPAGLMTSSGLYEWEVYNDDYNISKVISGALLTSLDAIAGASPVVTDPQYVWECYRMNGKTFTSFSHAAFRIWREDNDTFWACHTHESDLSLTIRRVA